MNKFLGPQFFLVGLFCSSLCALENSQHPSEYSSTDIVATYFQHFEPLAKAEKWNEIILQGRVALDVAKQAGRSQDEAKICAQLTSTAFYMGDYDQALVYAKCCHELSEAFVDPALLIRALYLESAVYRAQASYVRAVQIAREALLVYETKGIDNRALLGKVYFNLGAAHADNPQGDLGQAEDSYIKALECFKIIEAQDDLIRTNMRLGKVYLLQKKYDLSQKIIDEVRPLITSERLAMHADYLEAQLKVAVNDIDSAVSIAKTGLARAKALGAKEDEVRLISLLSSLTEMLRSPKSIGFHGF